MSGADVLQGMLGWAQRPDVLPLLVAALRDAEWGTRLAAARALGAMMMRLGVRLFVARKGVEPKWVTELAAD